MFFLGDLEEFLSFEGMILVLKVNFIAFVGENADQLIYLLVYSLSSDVLDRVFQVLVENFDQLVKDWGESVFEEHHLSAIVQIYQLQK